jgi:hypothetical protein
LRRETLVVGLAVAVKDPLGQEPGTVLAILADQEVVVVGQQTVGDGCQAQRAAIRLDLAQDKEVVVLLAKDRDLVCPPVVRW